MPDRAGRGIHLDAHKIILDHAGGDRPDALGCDGSGDAVNRVDPVTCGRDILGGEQDRCEAVAPVVAGSNNLSRGYVACIIAHGDSVAREVLVPNL